MAAYSIEIDENVARALVCRGHLWVADVPPSDDAIISAAQSCLTRYCRFPETVEQRHENALAICRARAVEAAANGTTEASRLNPEQVADRLLDFMLGR